MAAFLSVLGTLWVSAWIGLILATASGEAEWVVKSYDGWVGYYWNEKGRRLYIFLIPFIGFMIRR